MAFHAPFYCSKKDFVAPTPSPVAFSCLVTSLLTNQPSLFPHILLHLQHHSMTVLSSLTYFHRHLLRLRL